MNRSVHQFACHFLTRCAHATNAHTFESKGCTGLYRTRKSVHDHLLSPDALHCHMPDRLCTCVNNWSLSQPLNGNFNKQDNILQQQATDGQAPSHTQQGTTPKAIVLTCTSPISHSKPRRFNLSTCHCSSLPEACLRRRWRTCTLRMCMETRACPF